MKIDLLILYNVEKPTQASLFWCLIKTSTAGSSKTNQEIDLIDFTVPTYKPIVLALAREILKAPSQNSGSVKQLVLQQLQCLT